MSFELGFLRPNNGRIKRATKVPSKAMIAQTHPCRLKDEIPPKYAPMLQPKARRDPYPISRPPRMEAPAIPGFIFFGLNVPWKDAAIKAPKIIPKFSTLVESVKTEFFKASPVGPVK